MFSVSSMLVGRKINDDVEKLILKKSNIIGSNP